MDLTEIYRIFHPVATEYTFFSASHETFSKTCILGHKTGWGFDSRGKAPASVRP
jgi:hypothetical protein